MKAASLLFFAAFHAAAGCLGHPEDLLRYPCGSTYPPRTTDQKIRH